MLKMWLGLQYCISLFLSIVAQMFIASVTGYELSSITRGRLINFWWRDCYIILKYNLFSENVINIATLLSILVRIMFNLVYPKTDLKKWKIFSDITLTEQIVLAHIFGTTGNRAIFINSYDEVYGFGCNYLGALGIEGPLTVDKPSVIKELSHQKVLGISTGENHGLAFTEEGVLFSWGCNASGQLGDGSLTSRGNPFIITSLKLEKIVNAAAGSNFSLALTSDNKVLYWGELRPLAPSRIPMETVARGIEKVIYITAGWTHAVALSDCGKLITWGLGDDGTLKGTNKNPFVYDIQTDAEPLNSTASTFIKVACGKHATIAVNQLGEVFAWGDNTKGCLSVQPSTPIVQHPARVKLREPVTDIAASVNHQFFAAINQQTCNVFVWGLCATESTVMRYCSPVTVHCYSLFEAFCDLATPTAIRAQDEFQETDNLTDPDFVSVAELDLKWGNLKTLADRQIPLDMFNNREMSDITIKLNGSEIYAHKVILYYFSEHYRNMFREQWKDNASSVVDMSNYNPTAYSAYVKFVYSGRVEEIDAIDMFDFYLIAKEYGEERLAFECLQYLSEAVCVENVALLFSSAWKNKCQEMIDTCIKESAKNLDDVMLTKGFTNFTTDEWRAFCQLTATERKNQQTADHSKD